LLGFVLNPLPTLLNVSVIVSPLMSILLNVGPLYKMELSP
jgi:hypothetical protein